MVFSNSYSGNFTGTVVKYFTIVKNTEKQKDISKCKITVNKKTLVYNGKEQEKPEIEVRKGYSGPILTEGTDYSVSYEGDMVNVGIVNITITGKGDYVGTIKKSFEITTKSFRKCTVELSDYNLFYNKKEHKPEVTVKDGDQKLIENKDYTLKYENITGRFKNRRF